MIITYKVKNIMILLLIVIYFVILAVLEFIFILLSRSNEKKYIKLNNLENLVDSDINNLISINNLIINKSCDNVDIKNYIGKFYLESEYGFYINLNHWNLLESKKLYQFDIPVNIKIIKINENTDIIYYCDKKQ